MSDSQVCKMKLSFFCVIFLVMTFFHSSAFAQGTAEMLPPNKGLELVCAEVRDGKVHIIRSRSTFEVRDIEQQGKADDESNQPKDGRKVTADVGDKEEKQKVEADSKTVLVQQTYTVMIPYTEIVVAEDGKQIQVTRTRAETRTRSVPVVKGSSKGALRAVAYTVEVPYTMQVEKDGRMVTVEKSRLETRTRMLGENQKLVEIPHPIVKTYAPKQLNFFKVDGTEMQLDDVMLQLTERVPVVIVKEQEALDPFFQNLVRPKTILVQVIEK